MEFLDSAAFDVSGYMIFWIGVVFVRMKDIKGPGTLMMYLAIPVYLALVSLAVIVASMGWMPPPEGQTLETGVTTIEGLTASSLVLWIGARYFFRKIDEPAPGVANVNPHR